jgi:large subunit ribosomal protein L32
MVVRMRHTRAHTRNRRSHHALKAPALSTCGHCGAATRPHHMCQACGYYKGRQVLDLAALKTSRTARLRANRERVRPKAGAPAKTETVEKVEEAKAEAPKKKSPRTRSVKTGVSSKKEKQESS